MILSRFLYYSVKCDGRLSTEYDLPENYVEEDFPFKITDEVWIEIEKLVNECNKYLDSHGFKVIKNEVTYYDLEKCYEDKDIIFKFDDKYYHYSFSDSSYWEDEEVIGTELLEVKPVERIITVIDYEPVQDDKV